MPAIKFILSILLLIVIASFAVKNMGSVELSYYDLKLQLHLVELPLMVVLVIPLILGFLIAWFMGMFDRFKLKSTIRQQNRSIASMEEELERLKNTPRLPVQAESSTDS
ncbi:MAG: LapA family protein [Nitrospinae bacterium]|nr:LapA family protein [Nitrospinota bacterium]MBL7020061.1 LapA family protein [Nitrospinaceae bacterium]